jgi:hypothetical protein
LNVSDSDLRFSVDQSNQSYQKSTIATFEEFPIMRILRVKPLANWKSHLKAADSEKKPTIVHPKRSPMENASLHKQPFRRSKRDFHTKMPRIDKLYQFSSQNPEIGQSMKISGLRSLIQCLECIDSFLLPEFAKSYRTLNSQSL